MQTSRVILPPRENCHHEKGAASYRPVALSAFRFRNSGAGNGSSRGKAMLWFTAATAASSALLQVINLAGVSRLAPLLLHILIALAGTIAAIRSRTTRPKLLPGYLAFVVVAGSAGGFALQFSEHYHGVFWVLELAQNLMLMALALEIISDLLPRRLVTPWAVFFGSSLILAIVRQWPDSSNAQMLNVSISAMATAGLLLLALAFVNEIRWPRGYALATIGLAAVLAGNLLPEIQWITGTKWPLALQLGDVPGLIVLAVAAHGREKLQ